MGSLRVIHLDKVLIKLILLDFWQGAQQDQRMGDIPGFQNGL